MPQLEIFDPAMCCPTGVCGIEVDPALVQCQADLQWLAEQGVAVGRFNLSRNPQAFAANPAVRRALEAGLDGLPLTLIDGRIVATGAYLPRAELARMLGLEPPTAQSLGTPPAARAAASPFPVRVGSDCCKPDSGCC